MTSEIPTGVAPIRGGRAYRLSLIGAGCVMVVWLSLVWLVMADHYAPELNNPFLLVVGSIVAICGGAHASNWIERLPGVREFRNGAPDA